jgi:hypothetical protein
MRFSSSGPRFEPHWSAISHSGQERSVIRPHSVTAVAIAAMLACVSPCAAQSLREPSPRVEIGLVTSTFPGASNMALGIRMTIHGNGRTALEFQVDWSDLLTKAHYVDQQTWFYSWQVRHSFAHRDPRSALFVSYGTLGWAERTQQPGTDDHFTSFVLLPFIPLVGIGGQRVIGAHAAIRGDLQFMIWPFESGAIHPRLSAGVTVPIGRFVR